MEIKNLLDPFKSVENRKTEQNTEKSGQAAKTALQNGDRISLSPEARALKNILARAQESTGVRTAKVDQIKEQLASNTYQMDSRKTAQKMLEQEYALWGKKI